MDSGCVPFAHLLAGLGACLISLQPARAEWTAAAYFGGVHTGQTVLRVQAQGTDLESAPFLTARNRPNRLFLITNVASDTSSPAKASFTHLKVHADTIRNARL